MAELNAKSDRADSTTALAESDALPDKDAPGKDVESLPESEHTIATQPAPESENASATELESHPEQVDGTNQRADGDRETDAEPPNIAGDVSAESQPGPEAVTTAPRWSRTTMVVAGIWAVVLLLWVGGGLLWYYHHRVDAQQRADQQILVAASRVATDMSSINSGNAGVTFARLTRESTGTFLSQISSSSAAVQTLLQQSKAGSTGTVTAAGIEHSDQSSATALVAVSSVVTNNKLPQVAPLDYQIEVRLERVDNRWLASDLTFVR